MALTYGFYNAAEGDADERVYDAEQFGQVFDGLIKDGVYETFKKAFIVKASENQNEVIVQPGRAWFNHTWTYNDANLPITAPDPEVVLDRIDALVIDVDQAYDRRENSIIWVKGTPTSGTPEKPTMISETTHHQYPLAYVTRKAGTTTIEAQYIENAVGTSECPFVTGIISVMNIDDLIAQWRAEFSAWSNESKANFLNWFSNLQVVLDGDVAGHLQNEIDNIQNNLSAAGIAYSNAASGLSGSTIQAAIDNVADQLTANNKLVYIDYHDGKYGYNTDPNRGADTFNPFNNGGNRSIFKLGALGGTFDLSDYADYANFTVADNFYVQITSDNASFSGVSDGRAGSANFDGGCGGCSANISSLLSYNPATGILTTKNSASGSASGGIGETSYDGTRVANWSKTGTISHSIIGTVYLIINENPLDLIYNALKSVGITPESKGEGDIISAIKTKNKNFTLTFNLSGSCWAEAFNNSIGSASKNITTTVKCVNGQLSASNTSISYGKTPEAGRQVQGSSSVGSFSLR